METSFEIPKECLAGVVVNEGPNFELKVEKVPVPEPGEYCTAPGEAISTEYAATSVPEVSVHCRFS
jgi:hypothetical protein